MKRSELQRTPFKRATPKPAAGPRKRKCAICREQFAPRSMTHKACGPDCAAELVIRQNAKIARAKEKAERAETKAKLEKHKPLEYWLKKTEAVCNEYIRARDPDICISCGVTQSSAFQAGHFISVGANRTLRFHEDNIHKQCLQCNLFEGSNAIEYRKRLLVKIGPERLAWLEGWHSPVKMTREAAQEIEAYYKAKLRALKAN